MMTRSLPTWTMIAVLAGLMTTAILAGFPPVYYGGLLVVIILAFLLITKPFYFLIFLFAIRALCDNYFTSIRFSIGGLNLGLGGLFSVFMMTVTLFYIISQRERLGRIGHPVVLFYASFCVWSAFSAFVSLDRTGAMKDLISRYSVFSIFMMTLLTVRGDEDARKLMNAIVFSAFLPVFAGFIKLKLGMTARLEGTLSNPNITAYFLLVIMGALVFRLNQKSEDRAWSFPVFGYFVFLMAGFMLTLTRSAWAAFIFMVGLYALFYKRKWILPLGALALAALFVPVVSERLSELFSQSGGSLQVSKSSSLGWRFNAWQNFWSFAVQRPFFGHGINATSYVGNYHVEAHNDYLRFFLESGIVGVILYFGTYLRAFTTALRASKSDAYLARISRYLLCYLPAFLLMSVSENLARYTTVNFYSMSILAIFLALVSIRKEEAAHA